jgi:hypothetical protein
MPLQAEPPALSISLFKPAQSGFNILGFRFQRLGQLRNRYWRSRNKKQRLKAGFQICRGRCDRFSHAIIGDMEFEQLDLMVGNII